MNTRQSELARGVFKRWEFKTFGAPVWGDLNLTPGREGTWLIAYTPADSYPPDGHVLVAPFVLTIDVEADTATRH